MLHRFHPYLIALLLAGITYAEWVTNGPGGGTVPSLAVSGSTLFAGTWGGDVCLRPLSEMVVAVNSTSKNSPGFSALGGVLRPGQPIRFSLAAREQVSLDVFDPDGKKVAGLLHATLPAGEHEAKLKMTGPGGLYFLRLQMGGRSDTRRFLLMRLRG